MGEIILGADEANLLSAVKGESGDLASRKNLRETVAELKKCVIQRNETIDSLTIYGEALRALCITHKVPQPLPQIPYLPGTRRATVGGGRRNRGRGDVGKSPGVLIGSKGGKILKKKSRPP